MEGEEVKKTRVDYNHAYYVKHKAENDKRQLLSLIRTKGRVPHLSTVQRRNIDIVELIYAWAVYKDNNKDIPPNKIADMKALVSSMVWSESVVCFSTYQKI